jgi:hypothetical protein
MTQNVNETANNAAWSKTARYVVYAVIVVGLLLFASCGALILYGASSEPSETGKQVTATRLCRDAVKDHLKAPTTAKFDSETFTGSAGYYNITGQVSSENGFGAMIANRYTCTVNGSSATAIVNE